MKEDHFTNTPKDAAAYEQYRAGDDYEEPRPTLAELQRDEGNEFDKAVGCCSIGPLKLHTMNYEKTECIWCGPNALAWKQGRWVDLGNGFNAWSIQVEP